MERHPKWTEAQFALFTYWSARTKWAASKERDEPSEQQLARGKVKRRIEDIQEKRRINEETKEVWG